MLAVLAIATALLLLLALAFALTTVRLRLANDRTARRWARLESTWEPLILEVLAGTERPDRLHETVDAEDHLYFLGFLMRYHRLLSGDERDAVTELAVRYLPALEPEVLRGNAERRARAVKTLATLGMPAYTDVIVRALDDPSPVVAMIAARALFVREHSETFPAVLEHLGRFSLWRREFVAGMLAAGGSEAAPLLREILADPARSERARSVSANALMVMHDLPAVEVAADVLRRESDRELVTACLKLLAELGQAEHVALVRPLAESEDEVVRGAAVAAIGALGDAGDTHLLELCMRDPSPWVRLAAARALKALGAREPLLRLAVADDPGTPVARQVLVE